MNQQPENLRLIGLHVGINDSNSGGGYVDYDIGRIAWCALEAMKVAVLAIEQCVTGERLVHALDVGEFHNYLSSALEEENGAGVQSPAGDMASLQDEIQGLIDIVQKARLAAKQQGEVSDSVGDPF